MKIYRFLTSNMASTKMPDMASGFYPITDQSMPCLASFSDAMSGVKKLTNSVPAITCPASSNKPSYLVICSIEGYNLMPYQTSFFYSMSGVKKLADFVTANTCTT